MASIISVVIGLQLGAFSVVIQTLASGVTELPFRTFLLMMQPIHLAIGLVEGIVSSAIICFVYKMRPEILESSISRNPIKSGVSVKKVAAVLIIATIVTGGALSWFASSNPDGLEWAMLKTAGTAELEAKSEAHEGAAAVQGKTAFMPDYNFSSAGEEGSSAGTSVAGILGGAMTFALAGATGLLITRIKKKKSVQNV